jgi:hypothetical protein
MEQEEMSAYIAMALVIIVGLCGCAATLLSGRPFKAPADEPDPPILLPTAWVVERGQWSKK